MGLKTLIDEIAWQLRELPPVLTYESEITPEDEQTEDLSGIDAIRIFRTDDAAFHVEGEWVDRLVNRVNFNSGESLMYFERSLIKAGIIDRLREAGCEEGDTVHVSDVEFDFID